MYIMTLGFFVGFFVGRMNWSRNFKFIKMVQFGDDKYGVRFGVLGLYVYRNFNKQVDFQWHCKLSDNFKSACMVTKEKCEQYINSDTLEKVV